MSSHRTILGGVLVVLSIVACGFSLRSSSKLRQNFERYVVACQAARESFSDLSQAEKYAAAYAHAGEAADRDRSRELSGRGAAMLEIVRGTTPEDGAIQSSSRDLEQSYELAAGQIALAIEARQNSNAQRAIQRSKADVDALRDIRATAFGIATDASQDADVYRERSKMSLGIGLAFGLLAFVFAVRTARWKAIESSRARQSPQSDRSPE